MQKLEIRNINKIVGKFLPNGRWISEAGQYDDYTHQEADNYYKFVIYGDKNKDREYDGEHIVVLRRLTGNQYSPYDDECIDKYELFTMGLQAATSHYLLKSEIQNPDKLIQFIDKAINETKQFFENNN